MKAIPPPGGVLGPAFDVAGPLEFFTALDRSPPRLLPHEDSVSQHAVAGPGQGL